MLSVSKLLQAKQYVPGDKDTDAVRYTRQERPVIVWNVTKRCDLSCVHCYSDSKDRFYPGELTTVEGKALIDDLAEFRVPVLIFSGGDPLLREDLFELVEYTRAKGIRPILSASGVNIDARTAGRIKDSGIVYVGISLDGGQEVNDRLRGMKGAFNKAMEGLRLCRDLGLTVGIRFTMSKKTVDQMPLIFDLIETEDVPRAYFAHLVYAGRGEKFAREDLDHKETRRAVDYIFSRAEDFIGRGVSKDIVTGSNDVDGVYLCKRLMERDPERAETVLALLRGRGGNSSGVTLANIDPQGHVHPDQFWSHYSLGNVKERKFSEIWVDTTDPVMKVLKNREGHIKGRCGVCPYFDICGGNYRVRAEFVTKDMWAEDPACYLTDEELGMGSGTPLIGNS